jgi:hypothetical protein
MIFRKLIEGKEKVIRKESRNEEMNQLMKGYRCYSKGCPIKDEPH